MPEGPYPYVYVNADGSARELHASERKYLETEFTGGDGAMPYIKVNYDQRDGWGEISGYLERASLPAGVTVAAAPVDDPHRPLNKDDFTDLLRKKGAEVVENADGSLTIRAKPRKQ
ncbi:MAG TPA: hypothetical protein VEJ43_12710 [Pseudolabrys sp.]|nr:hypothetical protein [Pseudolabrys sp.]